MKRSHATRHRHLAAQRKAASSRLDRRIEMDAQGKEAARRARQAKRSERRWEAGPLRAPMLGAQDVALGGGLAIAAMRMLGAGR